MVPQIIVERLARVRKRELAVRLAWGAARGLAIAFAALFGACLIDWLVDLRWETPGGLRLFMLIAQVGLWIGTAAAFIGGPLRRQGADRDVALWVEEKVPALGHRLITAVELNRPGAPLEGMSVELLSAVTRQAEERATASDFAVEVDLQRVKKGALLAGGVLAAVAILFLAVPDTAGALLARQFLADIDIPRSVRLEAVIAEQVWPSGEEGVLRFRAAGAVAADDLAGEVTIDPEDRPSETWPMVLDARESSASAVFKAVIPPASGAFKIRAWLRDGRLRRPARVIYEPRPVVRKVEAFVVLPAYVGIRPDGKPYEDPRPRGEIAGPKGSSARVVIEAQKTLVKAALELLGRAPLEKAPEAVTRRIDLALGPDRQSAQGTFDLRPDEIGYRVLVEDRNGFANSTPPRRGVAIVADEPPRVALLPERFAVPSDTAVPEESEVEGMPIPIDSAIRIAYYTAHPYGLKNARLGYRIIKASRAAEGNVVDASEVPWKYLPLGEVRETAESGSFEVKRGAFQNTGFRDQVEFHPVPSAAPDLVHGRIEGGGRFDFQTRPLGGIEVGDQIEFFVEVFASNPDLERFPGRSETRSKLFVTRTQFVDWVLQTLKHESRIRSLEARQRGVFTPEGTDR